MILDKTLHLLYNRTKEALNPLMIQCFEDRKMAICEAVPHTMPTTKQNKTCGCRAVTALLRFKRPAALASSLAVCLCRGRFRRGEQPLLSRRKPTK